jgi:hypothetical protein
MIAAVILAAINVDAEHHVLVCMRDDGRDMPRLAVCNKP